MSKLFEIQGIAVDPTDLDPAVEKIANAVGTGFGDGFHKYDCFINYRVASDSDLAEKLFLYLKTKNIHAFLDKKCLKNGEKWKDGFLTGLRNSKCFVALISRKALDRVRDENDSHVWDNVLLEYETALQISEITNNPKYICPLHVGECDKGILTKFVDFSAALYPETLEPKNCRLPPPGGASYDEGDNQVEDEKQDEEEEAPAAEEETDVEPPQAPPTDDEGNGEVYCQKCQSGMIANSLGELPPGIPWGCDFPGHEGPNNFQTPQLYYGCASAMTCNYALCPTCYEMIQHSKTVIASSEAKKNQGQSKHDNEITVDQPQDASSSRVHLAGTELRSIDKTIYITDFYQQRGELLFVVPASLKEAFYSTRVTFVFGASGYSDALLTFPGSTYRDTSFPRDAKGHVMIISNYSQNGYRTGFVCDICRTHKPVSYRWFCQSCHADQCFRCTPSQVLHPVCSRRHSMDRYTSKPKSYGSVRCDLCKRRQLENDPEFYHCEDCKYDLCLTCASKQVAQDT
eukprot:gene14737-10542_t